VVDTSGSIRSNQPRGVENSLLITSFLTDIVRSTSLRIARHLDRVALITFQNTPRIVFDLDARTTRAEVVNGIMLIPAPYGDSNIPAAIDMALKVIAFLLEF